MNHAFVTIVAPLDPGKISEAGAAIEALGNPATAEVADRLDKLDGDSGVHFASLHALPSFTEGRAHLLLEFSADGTPDAAIAFLARAIGEELVAVFALASDWRGEPIGLYLARHSIKTGYGIGANPGIPHCGSPDMSVGRIRAEARLFAELSSILAKQPGDMSALDRLNAARHTLAATDPAALAIGDPPSHYEITDIPGALPGVALTFAKTYLWPWLLVLVAFWSVGMALICTQASRHARWMFSAADGTGAGGVVLTGDERPFLAGKLFMVGIALAVKLTVALAIVLAVIAVLLYARLRSKEKSDWISERRPDSATLHAMRERENAPGFAQNHMISLTERKPGWLRYFTSRLVFFVIANFGPRLYKPGYLGSIGTIHFARWITVPGTRDLVFVSNYGGSWESYLEDFITLAHNGLTGVWSNTVGFPKTTNLINDGATDGERFKRYARQSMLPTRFWYSAYPGLTTDMIRTNADIRRGLSGAMTEEDAGLWLSRFGSALRPVDKLVTNEIQSLLFGGLGFLRSAAAMLWSLPPSPDRARSWLAEVAEDIGWNDGRRLTGSGIPATLQLGLSATGLAALGLPAEGLASFPAAFLDGMPARSRILGDVDADAPARWAWSDRAHSVVLVYGESAQARDELRRRLVEAGERHGATLIHEIALRDLPDSAPSEAVDAGARGSGNARHDVSRYDPEPFGFADGISQPLIAGTYKAERPEAHPLHIVSPGEFILGYPDNRGNMPPGPCMSAIHDPANLLPIASPDPSFATNDVNQLRDLGRNGSFLAIRQLEQDVDGFRDYCEREARRLQDANRLSQPYRLTAEFIGAKMVGRWQNGTPLVRAPYSPSHSPEIMAANSFLPGLEDPEALRCPFGAHIRRANPRDSLNPGSSDQVNISNRHRIIRVGRKYQAKDGRNPGILFMCLNGDLERQFEFVQQTWLNGNVISLSCPSNLSGERDPVLSDGGPNTGFTIPSRDGPVKLNPLPRFVTALGGGYFFLPGRRLVTYLSRSDRLHSRP